MSISAGVISYITLGVSDLKQMQEFYSGLGFKLHAKGGDPDHPYVMYKSGALILALYPKHLLARQSGCLIEKGALNNSMSFSLNVTSKASVNEYIAVAKTLGAEVTREGFEPDWGGYCAYFQDPEENTWEIVWNEKFLFEV